jgi:hypothetical protein
MVVTDCKATAFEFIPFATDLWLLYKNRLTETSAILSCNWTVGHLYIELRDVGCHHCILSKINEKIEITDSFINYRQKETRTMLLSEFKHLFHTITTDGTFLKDKQWAYRDLFKPPVEYTDNWNGKIIKIYLEQIS